MRKSLTFLCFIVTSGCFAQDIDVLHKISSLQIRNDTFYHDGLFASQRLSKKGKKSSEDNNIFFTSLIVYTLESLRDSLSPGSRGLVDHILINAKGNFPRYRNRNGDITYNFWQTHPDQPFPNSKFLSRREKMKLPDDLDDTALIYLSTENNDDLNRAVKQKMMAHANASKIKSIYKRYRHYEAYTTWFGDKMPKEFDLCVMSNVLLFIFQKKLELTKTDHETLRLITDMILQNDHLEHPHIVSPSYQHSAVILYHVARLISVADNPILNSIRSKVIGDLRQHLQLSHHEMEKVILLTSLYRLGEKTDIAIDIKSAERDFTTFYWFHANLASGKNMLVKRILGKDGLFNFNYLCDAYAWTLLFEFQTLSKTGDRI